MVLTIIFCKQLIFPQRTQRWHENNDIIVLFLFFLMGASLSAAAKPRSEGRQKSRRGQQIEAGARRVEDGEGRGAEVTATTERQSEESSESACNGLDKANSVNGYFLVPQKDSEFEIELGQGSNNWGN